MQNVHNRLKYESLIEKQWSLIPQEAIDDCVAMKCQVVINSGDSNILDKLHSPEFSFTYT